MKKNTRIKRKTYETIFSFKIQGTPISAIVPPPAIVPPVPPLLPFPPSSESPFTPSSPSPFNPLPTTPPVYYEQKEWRKVIHRYSRDYIWMYSNYFDALSGEAGLSHYNQSVSDASSADPPRPYPSAAHPGDFSVEEEVMGYYPVNEFSGAISSRLIPVVVWNVYFTVQYVNYSETGVEDPWSLPGMDAGGASWHPYIARSERWELFFSDDPADSFWG